MVGTYGSTFSRTGSTSLNARFGANWPGMPDSWTHFDAAINWGNGKAYFFHGAEYARYDIALDALISPRVPFIPIGMVSLASGPTSMLR